MPPGARLTASTGFGGTANAEAERATVEYVELFRRHGLDPARAALAFVHDRFFTTSTIVGATSVEQLRSNLASADVTLSQEVLGGIEAIHRRQPNPAP